MKEKPVRRSRQATREALLRPCPLLGYDHDEVARHLMTRRAWAIAENELRHAIWLNPYEPLFKEDLALCLLEQKRLDEALSQAGEVLKERPDRQSAITLYRMIQQTIDSNAHKRNPSP